MLMFRSLAVLILLFSICSFSSHTFAKTKPIRILTWEGYITAKDIKTVNKILNEQGYDYHAEVLKPYASDAEQMYYMLRTKGVDMTFLTLFFIKMQHQRIAQYLQPINVYSPRLSHYQTLSPMLANLDMGYENGKALYIPFAGGIYGFWANAEKNHHLSSVNNLWDESLKGKISLNISQPWYNVGLALMSLGKEPFYLDNLLKNDQRKKALRYAKKTLLPKLTDLYRNAGHVWSTAPEFIDTLDVVSSWGPEAAKQSKNHPNWQKVNFSEGDMVWLDTINFAKGLTNKKLEASEIIANYFISDMVQKRVATELNLYPANKNVSRLTQLKLNPNSFKSSMFVPPYDKKSDNLINSLTQEAMAAAKLKP